MISCKTTLSSLVFAVLLFNQYKTRAQSVTCDAACPKKDQQYNLTCTPTGTFATLIWNRNGVKIMTCFVGTSPCTPEGVTGYQGFEVSSTNYVLQIDSLNPAVDEGTWQCQYATQTLTCDLNVIAAPTYNYAECKVVSGGDLQMRCSSNNIAASGTTYLLKKGNTLLKNASTDELIYMDDAGDDQTFSCSMIGSCALPSNSSTCRDPRPCRDAGIAFVAITLIAAAAGIGVIVFTCKKGAVKTTCIIFGVIWFVIGLIGMSVIFALCATIQPPDVIPVGGIAIAGVVLSGLLTGGGIITFIIALACL